MQRSVPDCSAGFSRFDASIAPPRGRAGADHRVDLVDEEDGVRVVLELLHHRLQPLLEVAAIPRAGEQRAHVEREDRGLRQHRRRLAVDDLARQPLGDRGLADAGVAHEQRVVLPPPAEDLDAPLDLEVTADQRIHVPPACLLVQVDAVLLQRGLLGFLGPLDCAFVSGAASAPFTGRASP